MRFTITTYRPERSCKTSKPCFYIQSHGAHAGRVLHEPIANCFHVETESEDDREFYFQVTNALYHLGYFREMQYGSVIPFLRIGDVKFLLNEHAEKIGGNYGRVQKLVTTVAQMQMLSENLQQQIKLLHQLQKSLMVQMLNPKDDERRVPDQIVAQLLRDAL